MTDLGRKKPRTQGELETVRALMQERLERTRVRTTPEEQGIAQNGAPPLFHDMLIIPPRAEGSGPGGGNATAAESRSSDLFRVPVIKRPRATGSLPAVGGAAGARPSKPQSAGAQTTQAVLRTPVEGATAMQAEPDVFPKQEPESGKQLVPAEIAGEYVDLPEKLDLYDYAQRRTMTIARPQDWGPENTRARGPAFGTLPVKREPAATHCFACYLVDGENFSFRNAWTAEEWNDVAPVDLPPHPSADDSELEVLLAGPRGKVFYLKLALEDANGEDLWQPGRSRDLSSASGSVESLNLRHEVEIWNQLRNGLVAGRVLSRRKMALDSKALDEVDYVPLVNVTGLVPDEPFVAASMGTGAVPRSQA